MLVLFNIGPGWDCDLDEYDLLFPLRVSGQEAIESVKLLRDAFDVVHAINADYDALATESLFELLQHALYIRVVKTLAELLWVYTDRKGASKNLATVFYEASM
jgi:hypothetical protein